MTRFSGNLSRENKFFFFMKTNIQYLYRMILFEFKNNSIRRRLTICMRQIALYEDEYSTWL